MRNPRSLLPVFGALSALVVLGMPNGVAAQGTGCVECERSNDAPPECVPLVEPFLALGYHTCKVEAGNGFCTMSSKWPDCVVTINPWLDGRVDVGSPVANGSVGAVEFPRSGQVVVSGAATPVAGERSACTGAIVQRRYLPARIAELRADLRHVTV